VAPIKNEIPMSAYNRAMKVKKEILMSEYDGQTVNFGERPTAARASAETSGHAVHFPGYMEAPSQVAGLAAEEVEGEARPQILQLSEE
jgi:hypothetical protein